MKINASSIGNKKPFCVRGEIAASGLAVYFDADDGCEASAPLTYDARLTAHAKFIALEADIRAALELSCHRCGCRFRREFDLHPVLRLIEASSVGAVDEIALEEDDLDTVTYQNGVIDLDGILLESIYLDVDGNCVCRDDCKGVCIQCGQNLNKGPCGCNK